MGFLPEAWQKADRPMGNIGQYTQSNIFSNPTYEQQGKAGRLANALMGMGQNPQQPQQSLQPQMQMGMNPMQAQPNMMGSAPNQMMTNWNSQYGSY